MISSMSLVTLSVWPWGWLTAETLSRSVTMQK
jgi:hypothetical protein